ncbi:MAG TPA: glucosaminidase domain-containing protein [Psychromonas sp.]
MKKLFYARYIAVTLISCLLIGACSYVLNSSVSKSEQLMANPIEVSITSLDDLNTLFDKYQYNDENWDKGSREVPRITFEGVDERWAERSKNMPVETKKMIFFRLMAPLVLVANENILREREIVKSSPLDANKLKKLALKYRVIEDEVTELSEDKRDALLARVDILPPSLTLAQAAEESGWATSRFAQEGNAFFGQWDFTGNGMKPRAQRKELGDYGVARFDSPLASVEAYMLNINSNSSYQKLRILRSELRAEDTAVTGIKLAGTLDKYSERGQEYIDGLRAMIRYNNLEQVDQAYLSDNKLIHLITEN